MDTFTASLDIKPISAFASLDANIKIYCGSVDLHRVNFKIIHLTFPVMQIATISFSFLKFIFVLNVNKIVIKFLLSHAAGKDILFVFV